MRVTRLETLCLSRPHERERPYDCAVAGIDAALWDLKGKVAGKRVSQPLADQPLEKVRLYASSGCRFDWRHNPEQLIEEALGYIQDGFTPTSASAASRKLCVLPRSPIVMVLTCARTTGTMA